MSVTRREFIVGAGAASGSTGTGSTAHVPTPGETYSSLGKARHCPVAPQRSDTIRLEHFSDNANVHVVGVILCRWCRARWLGVEWFKDDPIMAGDSSCSQEGI